MPEGGFVTRDIASVAFFPENKAEQFKQDTDDSQFITCIFFGNGGKEPADGMADGGDIFRDDRMDDNILMLYLL